MIREKMKRDEDTRSCEGGQLLAHRMLARDVSLITTLTDTPVVAEQRTDVYRGGTAAV